MKRVPKSFFFIVAALIVAFSVVSVCGIYTRNGDIETPAIKGINDIRWGIDIKGGIEATFKPAGDYKASDEEMDSAKAIIEVRLISNGVTDYELYADYTNNRIIVRYPWKSNETNFDPEKAIDELAATAKLTFIGGSTYDEDKILLDGSMIKDAKFGIDTSSGTSANVVSLEMNEEGTQKFADATREYLNQTISIWMDQTLLSAPNVNEEITSGKAQISGSFTAEEAIKLAQKIKAGALPFSLETVSFGSISPTLGTSSLYAMGLAAVIALILVGLCMIVLYRLPGFIAVLSLCGQMALAVAAVSGFFTVFPSFTMTLPGIAGLILSIGMGVDANVITAERIKDELAQGKTLDTSIKKGCQNSLWAIIDGNMTIVIVSIILMLVFGPSNILSGLFGLSTTGTVYSFGYTLLVGVIANFIMGICASRLMLKAVVGIKALRKRVLFGGAGK